MARDTFGSIKFAVQVNVGFHSQWVDPAATTILTKVQKQISEAYQWSYRKRVTFLQLIPPYSAGTVSLVQGSPQITGSGTAWDPSMNGRAIALSPEAQYFFVRQVVDPQTIILGDYSGTEFPWVLPSATNQQYRIFPIQYPLPDWFDIVLFPSRDWPVYPRTVEYFDRIDPLRTSTGRPDFFALSQGRVIGPGFTATSSQASGPDTLSGGTGQELRTIEFWPIADAAYTMRFPYLRRAIQEPTDGDIPLCPTELVEHVGTIRALRYLHVKSGDGRYLEQAQAWTTEFMEDILRRCIQEDVERFGVAESLSAGEVIIGSDQLSQRDWDVL